MASDSPSMFIAFLLAKWTMGMYISRIYCERHGGKLLIKNAADGGAEIEAVFKNYVSEKQQQK